MKTALPSIYQPQHELLQPEYNAAPAQEQLLSLGHYIWLLRQAWWKIAIAVVLGTGIAATLAYTLKPLYESTAVIAVDLHLPSSLIGESAVRSGDTTETDEYFNTELQQITSDTVLRPVAQSFGLMTADQKKPLPGGMRASDAPVVLKHLSVIHPPNSFLIDITYRSPNPAEAAAVANAVARSYIVRGREQRAHASMDESAFMEKQLSQLKKSMDDSELAVAAFEKQLGVINSDEKTSILAARLQQLNTDFTEAQNDRMRKQVDLQAFQSGSLAALEVSPQAITLTKMEENLHTAQSNMDAVKSVYGPANPEYKQAANALAEITRQYDAMQVEIGKRIQVEYDKAAQHEQLIRSALQESKAQSDALNANSLQYQELKREAESNKNLYTELFRKVKEVGINGAFQGSAVRIADQARPQLQPVFPNKRIFIGLGFLASLTFSIMAVLLADVFDKSLRDPLQTRREIGLDVIGILPHVQRPTDLSPGRVRSLEVARTSLAVRPGPWFNSSNFYEESANALLSTLCMSRISHPLTTVLVTSAQQGEGKSSCIAHLAASHARQGYKTLLIDADLRRPAQHDLFRLKNNVGLADAVVSRTPLSELRQLVPGSVRLDVITAGQGNSTVYEGVGKAVERILASATKEYDMIFIDAPPMLCFAEPIQLAAMADGVLVVCQAGETSKQSVSGLLLTLNRIGATVLGVVLNKVQQQMSSGYQPYQTYYRPLTRQGAA
jgi:capsular exopolysaccharide synthesis family protein